jgi:hypothetical protein
VVRVRSLPTRIASSRGRRNGFIGTASRGQPIQMRRPNLLFANDVLR